MKIERRNVRILDYGIYSLEYDEDTKVMSLVRNDVVRMKVPVVEEDRDDVIYLLGIDREEFNSIEREFSLFQGRGN